MGEKEEEETKGESGKWEGSSVCQVSETGLSIEVKFKQKSLIIERIETSSYVLQKGEKGENSNIK